MSKLDRLESENATLKKLLALYEASDHLVKGQPSARLRLEALTKAARVMDWQQVVLNGGPPCFHLQDDGRFCGRAERWVGHEDEDPHKFISLADMLETFRR